MRKGDQPYRTVFAAMVKTKKQRAHENEVPNQLAFPPPYAPILRHSLVKRILLQKCDRHRNVLNALFQTHVNQIGSGFCAV